jgi:hypothetical protein
MDYPAVVQFVSLIGSYLKVFYLHLLKYDKFLKGLTDFATNEEYQMLVVTWIDNKAVHFISAADKTDTEVISRRCGSKKLDISAPVTVKNYNKYMGGVD